MLCLARAEMACALACGERSSGLTVRELIIFDQPLNAHQVDRASTSAADVIRLMVAMVSPCQLSGCPECS